MKFLLIFSIISACANDKVHKLEPKGDFDRLRAKKELYLELIKGVQDGSGFLDSHECDSLLFTSLAQYSGVAGIDLLAARDEETHQWYRTPSKDCYDKHLRGETGPGSSKSDISKDMFAGLFWAARDHLGPQVMEEIHAYGKANNWVMGRGDLSRTWLSVNLQNTLAILTDKPRSSIPDLWFFSEKSHSDMHITVVHILLRGEIKGKISKDMLKVIKKTKERWPENAFFILAEALYSPDVDISPVIEALLDERNFPENRLPESSDRCPNYLWRHDVTTAEPCDEGAVHPGVDFLFMAKLLKI